MSEICNSMSQLCLRVSLIAVPSATKMHVPVSFLFKALPTESSSNLPLSSFPCASSQLLKKVIPFKPKEKNGKFWSFVILSCLASFSAQILPFRFLRPSSLLRNLEGPSRYLKQTKFLKNFIFTKNAAALKKAVTMGT